VDLAIDSLKELIELNRHPTALFNADTNLIIANSIFNSHYTFVNADKTLHAKGNSIYNYSLQENPIHLSAVFNKNKEKSHVFIGENIFAIIKALKNSSQENMGWIFSIKQEMCDSPNYNPYIPYLNEQNTFQMLAEYIPQIIWIANADGQLDYCNQRWQEYTGLNCQETIAGKWTTVICEDDLDIISDSWNRAHTSQKIYDTEFRIRRAQDGMFRWHLVRSFPIKNDDGEILCWFGTSTDIHDIKTMTQNLRASERRYHTLVQSLHSIYWKVDSEGAMKELQPPWEEFSGQCWEQYKDFGWLNSVHPDDRPAFVLTLQEAVTMTQIYQHIARFWSRKHNNYIYCIVRAAPSFEEDGAIRKWIGSCLDINEQKLNELRLKELGDHFNLALEAAKASMWSLDLVNRKMIWGLYTPQLFGLNEKPGIRELDDFITLIHPLDQQRMLNKIEEIKQNRESHFEYEYRVIWSDESIHFLNTSGKLYVDNNNQPIKMIGITRDITEIKKIEQLTKKHENKLYKDAKANSVAEIASSLAHELNQPLTAISTYLQGCISRLKNDDYQISDILFALERSNSQAERAGMIIHRIKNSLTNRSSHQQKISIQDLIIQSIDILGYDGNIPIETKFDENMPFLFIDKIQIQQVLINLITNSIEAIGIIKKQDAKIFISTICENDENCIIEVADNGTGFPPNILHSIESCVSTKVNGMGIGLAICRNIVERHGGKLNLFNPPIGGAVVQFSLPLNADLKTNTPHSVQHHSHHKENHYE